MRTHPDLDSCVRDWSVLRHEALAVLTQHQLRISSSSSSSSSSRTVQPGSLDPLVRRFRKLREGLTSCGAQDEWAVEVYEVSADVCAVAGNTAEMLKCLQTLVNTLYPAVEAQQARRHEAAALGSGASSTHRSHHHHHHHQQQQQQQHSAYEDPWGEGTVSSSSDHGNNTATAAAAAAAAAAAVPAPAAPAVASRPATTAGSNAHAAATQPLARQAEVHGALLLWFLCIPARPVHSEVAKRLRATPPALLVTPEFQLALHAASALMRGNWVRLLLALQRAPPLMLHVLQGGALAARGRAVRAMAVAYRSLPSAAVSAALGLQQQQQSSGQSSIAAAGSTTNSNAAAAAAAAAAAVLRDALVWAKDSLGSKGAAVALTDFDGGAAAELRFR